MSLNRIDRLFKSAFRKETYDYKDAYWQSVEAQLGSTKSSFGLSRLLSFAVILGSAFLFTTEKPETLVAQAPGTSSTKNTNHQVAELHNASLRIVKGNPEPNITEQKTVTLALNENEADQKIDVINEPIFENTSSNVSVANAYDPSLIGDKAIENAKVTPSINASESRSVEEVISVEIASLKPIKLDEALVAFSPSPEPEPQFSADKTEFGQKIRKSAMKQFFIQGGAYYLKLNQGNFEQTNIPNEFQTEYNSFNLSGGEIVVGVKTKGIVLATGVGVSSIAKTYSYKFTEQEIEHEQIIESNTYLQGVDSTFSHYQIEEYGPSGNTNFDIAEAVYAVDSTFVTEYDTINKTKTVVNNHNVALAYQLNYVNIPVQLGYEIEHKRFFANANVGIQVGVLSNYNGFKYNEQNEELKSTITSSDLNPVTLSYNLSVGLGYNVTPTISVLAQPMYASTLVGAFKDIKPKNIAGMGGKLSLRYQF